MIYPYPDDLTSFVCVAPGVYVRPRPDAPHPLDDQPGWNED